MGYDQLNNYVEDADSLRKGVDVLMTELISKNESILNEIHPELLADYKILKNSIKNQKDENE